MLDRGDVYGELDVSFKPVEARFSAFVPRVVVGVGIPVEVGSNVTLNVQLGDGTTALAAAVKWKPYDGVDGLRDRSSNQTLFDKSLDKLTPLRYDREAARFSPTPICKRCPGYIMSREGC